MRHENERGIHNDIQSGDERAASPLIGVTVLVVLTVVLGAVVFVSALGFADSPDEPRLDDCVPSSHAATSVYVCDERVIEVSLSEDPLAASGSAEVRINHVFGEPIASEDIRIEIDTPGGNATMERIREGGIDDGFVRHGLKPANAEVFEDPDNIIDSSGFTSKIPSVMEESDTAFFRLNSNAKLDQGPAEFEITHTPTGNVMVDEELSKP